MPAQTKPKSFESRRNSFFTRGGCVSCLRACLGARLLPQSYQYPNLSEGAGHISGQLHGDKECSCVVTKSGSLEESAGERCSECVSNSVRTASCVQSHASRSVLMLKIPNTGSHPLLGHTELLHTLVEMGSISLAVATQMSRKGQWSIKTVNMLLLGSCFALIPVILVCYFSLWGFAMLFMWYYWSEQRCSFVGVCLG